MTKKIGLITMAVLAGFAGCKSSGPVAPQRVKTVSAQEQSQSPLRENRYLKMIDQTLYTPFISEQMGPLPDHIQVKVAQWGILDGYDIIGYTEIPGDTIQDRVRVAEKYARAYGGEVIMAKGITSKEQLESTYSDRVTQGFLILRKKPTPAQAPQITVIDVNGNKIDESKEAPKKQDDSILQDLTEDNGSPKVYSQYSALPRLTYNKLIENSAEIKTQTYRGASYALKLFQIPEDIGVPVSADQKMAMLATKSGENKLFIIISSDKIQKVQEYIKSDKVMEFVYKPVGLYKDKYPILQFIDEMK
jgi:hypothetical protein